MGSDPLIGAAPFLVPAVLAAVLLALSVTAMPVLRGHQVTSARVHAARWASAGVLVAAVPVVFTESAEGLHGFILLAGIVMVAAGTLLRTRSLSS
ncbi:hypothetical protein [Kocuria sabuli]|uniref:hypothetical protein n=1 Tax=Kocuria sabuli TaxID=3071448 RepID=UPI0034D60F8D